MDILYRRKANKGILNNPSNPNISTLELEEKMRSGCFATIVPAFYY